MRWSLCTWVRARKCHCSSMHTYQLLSRASELACSNKYSFTALSSFSVPMTLNQKPNMAQVHTNRTRHVETRLAIYLFSQIQPQVSIVFFSRSNFCCLFVVSFLTRSLACLWLSFYIFAQTAWRRGLCYVHFPSFCFIFSLVDPHCRPLCF